MGKTTSNSIWLDFSLLKTNPAFCILFIARSVSLLAIGFLTVAVPLQVHALTQSSLHVGAVLALDGFGLFFGMMIGGVLADRHDVKRLIITARAMAGLGFVGLAVNSYVETPSLTAIYLFSLWGGFTAALSMSALMAGMPRIVGRENVATAGALSMLTLRIGTAVSPAFAGVLIAATGEVTANYVIAAVGTLITVLLLIRLPSLAPLQMRKTGPIEDLKEGVGYVMKQPILRGISVVAFIDALSKGVRVLLPVLVVSVYHESEALVGLLFACVPTGALIASLVSGWVKHAAAPGKVLVLSTVVSVVLLTGLGFTSNIWFAVSVLILFGYVNATNGIVQYAMLQGHTPGPMFGRVNAFWSAQAVAGDAFGAMLIGLLARQLAPLTAISVTGVGLLGVFGLSFLGFRQLMKAKLKANFTDASVAQPERHPKLEPVQATDKPATTLASS